MTGKEIKKWADDFMFEAEEQDATSGPEVFLLNCNNDPLGSIAAAAMAYEGRFVKSLAEVTDDDRRRFLREVQKTALAMPLESVHFHFRITGVTRGFTHQMVRQRTAAYSQESTRFAVKSSVPVGLPPSLQGCDHRSFQTVTDVYLEGRKLFPNMNSEELEAWAQKHSTEQAKWYETWRETVETIALAYNKLVDAGMPAEDARGLLPTNLLTQLNYFTNLRNYRDEAGKRLCTQAQFEWRLVFAKMVEAIRAYGMETSYDVRISGIEPGRVYEAVHSTEHPYSLDTARTSSQWQFDALADLFRPVCYYKGSCQFNADFDRKCSIKDRVEANAEINRPSTEWGQEHHVPTTRAQHGYEGTMLGIPAIRPQEWLMDPGAAR